MNFDIWTPPSTYHSAFKRPTNGSLLHWQKKQLDEGQEHYHYHHHRNVNYRTLRMGMGIDWMRFNKKKLLEPNPWICAFEATRTALTSTMVIKSNNYTAPWRILIRPRLISISAKGTLSFPLVPYSQETLKLYQHNYLEDAAILPSSALIHGFPHGFNLLCGLPLWSRRIIEKQPSVYLEDNRRAKTCHGYLSARIPGALLRFPLKKHKQRQNTRPSKRYVHEPIVGLSPQGDILSYFMST